MKRIIKQWADNVLRAILKRIAFVSSGIHSFSAVKKKAELVQNSSDNSKKWLLVVARHHYFESTRDYPIGHLGDLKKLVKNAPWRFPYNGVLLNRIERLSDQSHRVTSWVIRQEVLDALGFSPLWIVPESACLESFAEDSVVELERLGEKVVVSVTPDGLRSSLVRESFASQELRSSRESNHSEDEGLLRFNSKEAAEVLLLGIIRAFKRSPKVFFIGVDTKDWNFQLLIRSLKVSAALCLSYFMLTSASLLIASSWIDHKSAINATKVEPAMAIRASIVSVRKQLTDLQSGVENLYPHWVAWDVLIDLSERDVIFRSINSSSGSVTYYLTAQKATEVLSIMTEDRRIVSAELTVPVRRTQFGEEFAVKVEFNPTENLSGARLSNE